MELNIMFDKRLSLKAKGLYCVISENLAFGMDNLSVKQIAVMSTDGIEATSSAVKELEMYGYLKRSRERTCGQYSSSRYELMKGDGFNERL